MSETFETEGLRAASRAVKSVGSRELPNKLTLSNGVVLKIKPMPPMLLNSVANSIPEPPVPKVYIEEKDREEENPNHPAYLKALEERQTKIGLATNNLVLFACTEIEYIPEGMMRPEDEGWIQFARLGGIEVNPEDKLQRHVAWLKCYAIANVADMLKVTQLPIQLAGVSEEEVQEIMDAFRSGTGGDADTEVSPEQPSTNGHNISTINPRGNRAGRRARGESS